ncbi:MAG: molybdopterin dinucleotide binding domain-containing protein, partial [Rhodospirillales bacterium]|nr:molybdopterin dinucleotide binding domain-containing protein [Rhodospirillales bacterium]
ATGAYKIPRIIYADAYYSEMVAYADLVLPDTTYLERWDCISLLDRPISEPNGAADAIRQPVVKPLGEVRDFGDVACELSERMGFSTGFKTKEAFVKDACEHTKGLKEAGGFNYLKRKGVWHDAKAKPKYFSYKKAISPAKLAGATVILDEATGVYWDWKKAKMKSAEEARKKGYTKAKKSYKAYIGQKIGDGVYSGFKPDKVNKSGHMELYSEIMEAKGLAPLPTWLAVPEHEKMKPGELILTTYKVSAQIHSRSANCKWLTEITHDNPAWINPVTAAAKGIGEGDKIKVASAVGEITTRARVTPAVMPGVIAISHHCGHWEYGRYASGKESPFARKDSASGRKWWKRNGVHPNWIIPNAPDPANGQMRFMDTVVTVAKA